MINVSGDGMLNPEITIVRCIYELKHHVSVQIKKKTNTQNYNNKSRKINYKTENYNHQS
jgi:hypothetical protein